MSKTNFPKIIHAIPVDQIDKVRFKFNRPLMRSREVFGNCDSDFFFYLNKLLIQYSNVQLLCEYGTFEEFDHFDLWLKNNGNITYGAYQAFATVNLFLVDTHTGFYLGFISIKRYESEFVKLTYSIFEHSYFDYILFWLFYSKTKEFNPLKTIQICQNAKLNVDKILKQFCLFTRKKVN